MGGKEEVKLLTVTLGGGIKWAYPWAYRFWNEKQADFTDSDNLKQNYMVLKGIPSNMGEFCSLQQYIGSLNREEEIPVGALHFRSKVEWKCTSCRTKSSSVRDRWARNWLKHRGCTIGPVGEMTVKQTVKQTDKGSVTESRPSEILQIMELFPRSQHADDFDMAILNWCQKWT